MPDGRSSLPASLPLSPATAGAGALLGLFGGPGPGPYLTLPIAERVRAALMRASDSKVPWQISGKDSNGQPRRGHDHLYILPFASSSLPGAAAIDRVLLWANGGLTTQTVAVLERIRERSGWMQLHDGPRLRLELLAIGSHAQLSVNPTARLIGPARRWRSATSFVPPRFPKRRGGREVDSEREQLARLLAEVHGHPVHRITPSSAPADRWRAFEQRRAKQSKRPRRPASGWIIEFAEPVRGPIALGYGAHFGLGRFDVEKIDVDEDRSDTHPDSDGSNEL